MGKNARGSRNVEKRSMLHGQRAMVRQSVPVRVTVFRSASRGGAQPAKEQRNADVASVAGQLGFLNGVQFIFFLNF